MGKFSTYRYFELKDNTSPPHINVRSRKIKQTWRIKNIYLLVLVFALCVMLILASFSCQTPILDGFAKSFGYKGVHHHAVVIDAGSSGSRVLAYTFREPLTVFGKSRLDLEEEYFAQSKPGLSSYADDPKKGADTIVQLIKQAEFLIPQEERKNTPLLIRATAGLRLLPQEKAQQLLDHVTEATDKLGYDSGTDAVQIMDGSDEGIFIWYTLNLLHDNLMDGSETMAALDLGGGSTQITYQLSPADVPHFPAADKHVVPDKITLYTHSYLNLGLLAARYGILRLEANDNDTSTFTSVCVDPIVQGEKWVYANKQYVVNGAPRAQSMKPDQVFARCQQAVEKYVNRTLSRAPPRPPRGRVAAMSFFYDVAADAGIIDVMSGGTVPVVEYRHKAIQACSASNVEQPWACSDLTYILTLLHSAYRMPLNEQVALFKKVNNHEVSWALGLAYTTMMKHIAARDAAV